MKPKILAAILTGAAASNSSADNLIWSDNFNVPDSGSFDGALLTTGRRGGFFPTEIEARSANAQHSIVNQQLRLAGNTGRIRLEVPPGGAPVVSYNFAAGSAGAQILSGGGLRVEFDYVPTNNTSDNWLSVSTGFPGSSIVPEPGGFRLNDTNTDFGFLLRNNGGTQFFKNNTNSGTGGNFPATTTSRHVVVRYGFTSLSDLSSFTVVVSVDGTEVINQAHSWSNNSGQLLVELGGNEGGNLVDNLQFFELSPTRLQIALDNAKFESSFVQGSDVGTLSALLGGVPGGSNYTLVSGTGDTDNGKFQITGDKLEVGTFNFTGANSIEGQQFSVRVRGTSTGVGGQTDERVLVLTVVKDDDSDHILDAWEIAKAGNITTLNGNGVADFDGDGLTDLEEYKISLGTSVTFPVTYVNINPTLADSDSDGLNDREELVPGYQIVGNLRPATNPTVADTDADGLSDLIETNTETYASATNTGSDPTAFDTDLDGLGDGFETTNHAAGYDPNVDDSGLDTDGDTLTTADEVFYKTSVISKDTDGDTLEDNEEVFPTSMRPPTNPALADTDFDGLSDLIETNTTVFVSGSNTGSDPTLNDTDGDASRDGVEVAAGTNPLLATSRPTPPAGVALVKVTDDASTGISTSKTYTHKISGGGATTINGVVFDVLTNVLTPPNFTWTPVNVTNNPSRDFIDGNNGDWVPANGGVTGPGLLGLFDSFTYGGNGATVGTSKQTYTLSGLTPGTAYQLKIFIRMWDNDLLASGRPIDLVFKNGAAPEVRPFQGLYEDRTGTMLNTGNLDDAYYLSFNYVAQGTTLVVDAEIPASNHFVNDSGSFHFYGLTNESTSATPSVFAITSVSRTPTGSIIINFTGAPNTVYDVTKSPNLSTPFGPLTIPMTATTNASGIGQATVPASEASEVKEFYRIED